MAISRFSTSSVAQGLPKYQKVWDGVSVVYDSDFELITRTTLSTSASSVVFSSIPGTYKHLQIRLTGRGNYADPTDDVQMIFNNDTTSSYVFAGLSGDGSTAYGGGGTYGTTNRTSRLGGANAASSIFGVGIIDILDYTNTNKFKTGRLITGVDLNGAGYLDLRSLLWGSTSAITQIALTSRYGTSLSANSTFALYGIK